MKKKVDLGHFTMSEESTTWAICELSLLLLLVSVCCLCISLTARCRANI